MENIDNPQCDQDALLREDQAARFLGVSPRALANWRSKGIGPSVVRISNRCLRYRRKDLIAFAEEHLQESAA
jgi:hypothetical protein